VDLVDLVDLTVSDHQDTARKYLVAREILEPVDHDSAEHRTRATRDGSSDGTDNDKIDDGNEDDNGNDHNSEASDLPSLQDSFAQANKQFGENGDLKASTLEVPADRTRKERYCKGDSEDRVNLAVTTVTRVQPGASQGE
jgi:hypothetical protein